MASSFNDSYVARRAMAIIASLLTLSCAPPAASTDVGVDSMSIGDVGTDASYDWPDAFAMDASVEDNLCTGMPVPRGLPCEPQLAAVASGCGGTGRVVYVQNEGCRLAAGETCGAVRGAFNTFEDCAMACGRLGRSPFSSRYQPASGGEGFRSGPLDFSPACTSVAVYHGVSPAGTSRCAHLGFLAPLYEGTESGVRVPPTMSNQDAWELLNATELLRDDRARSTEVLCVTPL